MFVPLSAGASVPVCEQPLAPAGSTQYWTRSVVAGGKSFVFAQAMYAVPAESTATAGGPLSNGVPTLIGVPLTASAFAAKADITAIVSRLSNAVCRSVRRDAIGQRALANVRAMVRNIPDPDLFHGPVWRRGFHGRSKYQLILHPKPERAAGGNRGYRPSHARSERTHGRPPEDGSHSPDLAPVPSIFQGKSGDNDRPGRRSPTYPPSSPRSGGRSRRPRIRGEARA